MIDGTRPYRGKKKFPHPAETPEPAPEPSVNTERSNSDDNSENTNAVNLDRRKWFSTLIPAFGAGLVDILRKSNNLKRDISELSDKVLPSSDK